MNHPPNKLHPTELSDALSTLTDEQLGDADFLTQFIMTNIGISINRRRIKIENPDILNCWMGFCCKQYPSELGQFLAFLHKHPHIKSYMEIGVERAGTFMLIDGFLRHQNKEYAESLGIDVHPVKERNGRFAEYHNKYPSCNFKQENFQIFSFPVHFDLCFIDATHTYECVKQDFEKAIQHVNMIAMHDIFFNKGINRFWNELQEQYDSKYFTEIKNLDDRFPGDIGIGIYHPHFDTG